MSDIGSGVFHAEHSMPDSERVIVSVGHFIHCGIFEYCCLKSVMNLVQNISSHLRIKNNNTEVFINNIVYGSNLIS